MLKTLIKSWRFLISSRRFCSTTWEEVRIPVPWGHIAGKWWGPRDRQPILTCHGWKDNSGSFDTLIPLLPKTSSFLAIDFPGCGHSSKLPPGAVYHLIDSVILIRRIVKYFGWEKTSLLGHSMGAAVNYTYSTLYPDEVTFLILLEGVTSLVDDHGAIDRIQTRIIDFLKYDNINSLNQEPPTYTYQEMQEKVCDSMNSIDLNKSKYMLERCIKPSSKDKNKYYFTVDPRLKIWDFLRWSEDELVSQAHRLTCPIIIIKAESSPLLEMRPYASKKVFDVISKNNKNFQMHVVKGSHHVHLNNPERLESLLNQFILKYSQSDFKKENLAPGGTL